MLLSASVYWILISLPFAKSGEITYPFEAVTSTKIYFPDLTFPHMILPESSVVAVRNFCPFLPATSDHNSNVEPTIDFCVSASTLFKTIFVFLPDADPPLFTTFVVVDVSFVTSFCPSPVTDAEFVNVSFVNDELIKER